MKPLIRLVSATVWLAGCATTSSEISKTETVTSNYSTMGFSVSGKRNANIAARAFEHMGKVGVCAVIGENRDTLFGTESVQYVRDGVAFFLAGDRVMSGAAFAPVYPDYKSLGGKSARCAVSDAPWKSKYQGKRIEMSVKPGYIGS